MRVLQGQIKDSILKVLRSHLGDYSQAMWRWADGVEGIHWSDELRQCQRNRAQGMSPDLVCSA